MTNPSPQWETQGCAECRASWQRGEPAPTLVELGVSQFRHATLHQCNRCGAYWEQCERYAHEISSTEAKEFFDNDPAA